MHNEIVESLSKNLAEHQRICEELLAQLEVENQNLREGGALEHNDLSQNRKKVLALLEGSVASIKADRGKWMRLDRSFRAGHPVIVELLKQTQLMIARVMLFDRENEQLLLRRGLMPANHIPSVNRHRPHYVAGLYQQHAAG